MCLSLSGRRPAQNSSGAGDLRRIALHGLPILYAGLPLQRSEVRVEQVVAARAEMRHVRGPGCRRAPNGLCRSVSNRATKFGERDDLIAEAKDRIAKAPDQYLNHIYGLEEAGGTSVLLLSSAPFESFGLHTPKEPLPMLTYRALSHIPDIVSLGGVLLGGVWWITSRRAEVAAAEAEQGHGKKGNEEEGE